MGVTISTQATLAPVSLASTIIGFISFAFTVATFLRVFWQNLLTVFSAAREVHDVLSTCRQELMEERASLRALRRHMRRRQEQDAEGEGTYGSRSKAGGHGSKDVFSGPELDEEVIYALTESLRHLIRRFSTIEQPFLNPDERSRRQDAPTNKGRSRSRRRRGRRRRSARGDSFSPERDPVPYSSFDDEKRPSRRNRDFDFSGRNDPLHPGRHAGDMYCNITLPKRIQWLRYRGDAMSLLESLSRLQTRRIARQVGEIATVLHEYGTTFEDIRHNVTLSGERLNRVVGVRRVE